MERKKVITAGISSLILTVGIARFAYTPILPLMKEQINLSDVAGGWLASVYYIGYFAGLLLAVNLKSLVQKFYFYRISLIVAILTTIGMGLTTQSFIWGILRVLSGFSSIAGLTLASGLVLTWLTSHQFKKELGLHFSGIGIGIFVSGIVFVLFEKIFSWDLLWIVYGVLGIIFFIPAWFWMPKPDVEDKSKTTEQPISKSWLALMSVIYFCAGFGFVISATFTVDIFKRLNAFQGQSVFVWIIVGLAGIPATYIWDIIARKTGQINALIIAYLMQIASVLIPACSAGKIPNLIGAILFGSAFVGIVSLMLALIGNKYSQNPAKAMAKLTLSYGIAQIIAPIMSGYFVKTTGSYTVILCITGAMLATGATLFLLLKRL